MANTASSYSFSTASDEGMKQNVVIVVVVLYQTDFNLNVIRLFAERNLFNES